MNAVTQNACKQCAPLGASLVFKGLKNTISLIHGSQGCATYIRRYLISHYREPIDIASSSFTEETAVFGGGDNLKKSITNVTAQYAPDCIGIASTCLSETIGEDVQQLVREYKRENIDLHLPQIICVNTPSYQGTHAEGFNATVLACVKQFAENKPSASEAAVFPGMLSPADIRYVKLLMNAFFNDPVIFPDYSETLDGGLWSTYHPVPEGGTSVEDLKKTGGAGSVIEFSSTIDSAQSAGAWLHSEMNVPLYRTHIPMGVQLTDALVDILEKISGKEMPEWLVKERSRVIDLYIDGHKYVFGKRVLLYGDEDLVAGLFSFCQEIGLFPVLCCSGNKSGNLRGVIDSLKDDNADFETIVLDGVDFAQIEKAASDMGIEIMIGNSKGYKLSQTLHVPLIRAGFPVHDRIGAGHILHIGYLGALAFYEKTVNTILQIRQESNTLQYGYL